MAQSWSCWCWQLRLLASSLMLGGVLASGDCALAQITPDGTLGAESSVVTPTNNNGLLGKQIDGGAIRGTNLFHSFEQFSVPKGSVAYFNNALDIQNIISRVTGKSVSNIDGLLRANGTANVFLLNPNGIIFGSNATLAIGGSFLGSTASGLNFADGTQFSATAPQTTPLLTISLPIGLQFGENPGRIFVQGNGQGIRKTSALIDTSVGLRVQPKQTLALVGGDIELAGGTLKTAGGRIELGSVADLSLVSLTPVYKGWALGYQGVQNFRDIKLFQQAAVDASGLGGGDIQVQGRQVSLLNGSQIEASTLGAEPGGTLTVTASELVKLMGTSTGLSAVVYPKATGAGGNVILNTRHLSVQDKAYVSSGTFGSGKGGNLTVADAETVELVGSRSNLSTQTRGTGAAGNLTIATRRLSVLDGAFVSSDTLSDGQAGNLTVTDAETVELVGSRSNLSTQTRGTGAAGNLTIATRRLSVLDGAQVLSDTSGLGQGGTLFMTASESVELKGTSREGAPSRLSTDTFGTGNAGNLTIATRRLSVQGGAQVSAATFGLGNGGDIQVNATNSINLSGIGPNSFSSGLFTRTAGMRQAGNITVDTSAFRVADGAVVDARTTSAGSGGNITVKADTFEAVNGGQLLTSTFRGSSGLAGNITVNTTDRITISGSFPTSVKRFIRVAPNTVDPNTIVENDDPTNSGLFVLSRGLGNAGKLDVTARSISLDNYGTLTSKTTFGEGGNITLKAGDILLRNNSSITATAGTTGTDGNGGNITIDTDILAALKNSDITANAFQGRGGNIQINTQGLFLSPDSQITASSERGIDGVVEINRPDVDPSQGLVALPSELVDASNQIATGCAAGGENEFIVTGRGGLPPSPTDLLNEDAVWTDLDSTTQLAENHPSLEEATQTTNSTTEPLVEATGWTIDDKGQVILIAASPASTPNISKAQCHAS